MICLAFAFSGFGRRHLSASFRTPMARFGATLAMLHFLVLGAFIAAALTDLGAKRAQFRGEVVVARHPSRRHRADVRAGAVERDAARHHFHVLLA